MYWKLRGKAFTQSTGEVARQMQYSTVESGTVPGLLAYHDAVPVGWVAVEPRSEYPRLTFSRILKPVDDAEAWSVTCFYISKGYRRQSLTYFLLKAAISHVSAHGGRIVEGYPVDAREDMPDPFVFTGLASVFLKVGFYEVAS